MATIPLDHHLCFKLYVASRLIIRGYAERLAPLKLTYPKYLVLLALSEENGQTVGHLAGRLALDFGTVSPLLKSLATSGFVERRRHPDDDRTVVNHITPPGRAALKKAMAIAYDLFCETGMPLAEFTALSAAMDDYVGRCRRILETSKSTSSSKTPVTHTRASKGAHSKGQHP